MSLSVSFRRVVVIAVVVAVAGVGWIVAATASRPLDVELETRIDICEKGDDGWEVVDRVGPETVRFTASLLELAGGDAIESAYELRATSEKGVRYTARLAGPAKIDANPVSGRLDAELTFAISYGDLVATVPARLTTDSVSSPLGNRRGRSMDGALGRGPAAMTLVSSNVFERKDDGPLMLVCTERYRLTPVEKPRQPKKRP